jgi:hypothetical protein
MRVAVVRGGGIAGVVVRTELESEALAAPDAATFERLARQSGLTGPGDEAPGPAPGRGADRFLYAVTVDDGERERTARFDDETLPDPVRELIEWVDGRPESKRRIGR